MSSVGNRNGNYYTGMGETENKIKHFYRPLLAFHLIYLDNDQIFSLVTRS